MMIAITTTNPLTPLGKKPPWLQRLLMLAALAAEQQVAAEQDHPDDRRDFDDGEPELRFAKSLYVDQVDGVDGNEEHRRRHPHRDIRPPVVHVLANRGELGHAHQHIKNPVVPAGQEAGEGPHIAMGKMAERAGDRLLYDHFAQLAHDQKGDQAADGVAEDH
jgi:hypothetical protein